MKILLLADKETPRPLQNILEENKDLDLIITLWDLYDFDIEALKNFPNIPKIGIYGNHCDWLYMPTFWISNLHLNTYKLWWITFWWFEWCVKYKNGRFQYTQEEANRLIQLLPKVDVIISHCPPFWINDNIDSAHIWFKALRDYIEKYSPKYLFHWHTYDKGNFVDKYLDTNIIYVHREKIIEV